MFIRSRAEIDMNDCFPGNGVDSDTTLDDTNVERRSGTTSRTHEVVNGVRHRMNRVRPPEVRPTVTARSGHANTIAATPEPLIRDAMHTSAVERDEFGGPRAPGFRFKRVPDAAQIPLPFFADVRNAPNGPPKPKPRLPRGAEHPQKRHKARAIIGDAGQVDDTARLLKVQLHLLGKHRVQVG